MITKLLALQHVITDTGTPERVLLQGVAGEVGRAFYWCDTDKPDTKLTGRGCADRMHFSDDDAEFERRLDNWVNKLTGHNAFLILDLLYIEHRLGMAHGPAQYYDGDRFYKFSLFPMNDRRIFSLMLSLPTEYRRRQALFDDICRLFWPGLRAFPINAVNFAGIRSIVCGLRGVD